MDWVIGTGEYEDDMKKSIKKSIIRYLIKKRYGKNGYLWIINTKGTLIMHPYLKNKIGKNIINLKDKNGKQIVKLFIKRALKNKNGDFVSYYWYKPSSKKEVKKISYVKYIKELDWIIGMGDYVDDVEKYIKFNKKKIDARLLMLYKKIAAIFVFILLVVLAISWYLSLKTKKLFRVYSDDLEHRIEVAVKESEKKDKLMQQQSKLAAMGEMIGAIAHQWRQPLNTLMINIQNLKYFQKDGYLKDKDFISDYVSENKKIIKFMSRTIDDFRNFFKIDKEKRDFSIMGAVNNTLKLLSAQLKNHNIEFLIEGEDFECRGYEREFQQVLLNIINNAKDAIIEKGIKKGYIKIKIDKQNRSVTISDNGGGISDKIIERIFEPYFTTKEQGRGTGMGLYISKMIIEENHNGKLSVASKDGKSEFRIDMKRCFL